MADNNGDDDEHQRPPPMNMMSELQKRPALRSAQATPTSPKSPSPGSPKSPGSGGEMTLQEKLAARRAKLDNPSADSAPSTAATSPKPVSLPVPVEKAQPDGRPKPAAVPRPAPGATQEPSAKRAPPQPVKAAPAVSPIARKASVPAEKVETSVHKKAAEPVPVHSSATKKPVASKPTPAGDASDWITHLTADGEPYYVNRRTGQTTWDKPAALMQDGEQAELEGEWIWVQHEELAWIPAKVVSKLSDGGYEVIEQFEGSSNERRRVKPKEVGPPIKSMKHLTSLTSDLVQLDEVHEPGIIDLLRRRYTRDKIYTSVGDILIAVNPFKSTSLFTSQIMHEYADRTKTPMELPPHPYAVINGSLQDLIEFQKDQSLLISGESGAGKTVTVKVCLEFISEIAGSSDNVEEQILASNPLLEAFGNAKTKRNDNSSRFGKFMEVHLSKDTGFKIVGCSVVHYLLEKSRVVHQAEGERNFHSFYYVVSHTTAEERKKLFLQGREPESFKFLSKDGSPCAPPEQHNDVEECHAMRNSFKDMNVSSEAMMDCFKVVAAVLHLGDIEFAEHQSTGSKVANRAALESAATLLGVSGDMLEKVLTKHESMQRDGLLSRAFNPAVAADARNALARHAYGRLFDYLIRMVNRAMAAEKIKKMDTQYIGMLDIFGFEIFDINSFEQLSINFANEKLQQLFNRHTFTLEEKTYEDEGIDFDHITFHDSQPLLTFLGMGESKDTTVRDGVFQILDEQTVVGSGTDDKFLQAIGQRHRDKKTLFSDLCKIKTRFKVFHYAGAVEYETSGFVAKNADKLYENIVDLMRSSSSTFLAQELFGSDIVGGNGEESAGGSSMKPKTQASLFMRQLQALEQRTNSTFPRYVRCIKPNAFKKPRLFDSTLSLQQLRFAGVFEAVAIRKLGFPFRHTHQHFFEYFKCLTTYDHAKWQAAKKVVADGQSGKTAFTTLAKKLWEDIVAGPVPEARDCRFGKSMVLFRAMEHRSLEIARLSALNRAAAKIQKIAKGRYVRRHTPELREAKKKLEAAIQSRDEAKLDDEITKASVLFFKIKAAYDAEAVRASVRQEKKMKPKLQQLLKMDPDSDPTFEAYDSTIREIDSYIAKDKLAFQNMEEAHQLRQVHGLCKERRDVKATLRQLVDDVPVGTLVSLISELDSAVKHAEDLGKRGQASGGTRFFSAELEEAKENLNHLKKELDLIHKAVASSSKSQLKGDVAHVQPGDLDTSQCRSGVGKMRADTEAVRAHIPRCADSIEAMVALETILDLRESALLALDLGEGAAADEAEWRRVESVLRDVRGLEAQYDLFHVDQEEVDLIANDLALRAAVDDVVNKLNEAIAAVDDEQLTVAIDQAKVLKMFDHPDDNIRTVCYDADELLPKVQHARASLAEALRQVKEDLLRDALCAQSAIGFGVEPGMLGYEVVQKARQLYAWVVELTAEARLGAQVMYTEPCKSIVEGCDEIRLQLPELDPIRKMLALNKHDRLLRQRDHSVTSKNYRRAIRLQIEAKDCVLDNADRENMALSNFPGLKTPEDFSRRFGIHWKKYKDNMLTWYNPLFGKIHTSLTHIEGKDEEETKLWNKKAPHLFKNVFAVMGDKKIVEVDGLAHEILVECLAIPVLRDEVYCQLMKQLTQNPNPESESRGWNLMAMCCATFPPSSGLENYLEYFLRKSTRSECVHKLHLTLLGGALLEVPSVEVISRLRQGAVQGETSFWMPGNRVSISFEEQNFTKAEKIEQIVLDWRAVQYRPNMEYEAKRMSKRRNSGGFMIHVGGDAPKLGAQGLSRVPSFMVSQINLGATGPSGSFKVGRPASSAPPSKPGASAPPPKPSAGGPPPKPSAGGPPPRPGGSGPPPRPPPKSASAEDEGIDDAPAPPKPVKPMAAAPPLAPKPAAAPPPVAPKPAAAPPRPAGASQPPPRPGGAAPPPRPGGGPPPRPGAKPIGAASSGPPSSPSPPKSPAPAGTRVPPGRPVNHPSPPEREASESDVL